MGTGRGAIDYIPSPSVTALATMLRNLMLIELESWTAVSLVRGDGINQLSKPVSSKGEGRPLSL